jgi:hypothetical protein
MRLAGGSSLSERTIGEMVNFAIAVRPGNRTADPEVILDLMVAGGMSLPTSPETAMP